MGESEKLPWERQPGEPALWFGRFVLYRELGPTRTVVDAWRSEGKKGHAQRPHHRWYDVATAWHWDARATAYDEYIDTQRLIARQEEIRLQREAAAQAREDARQQRRKILELFYDKLSTALEKYITEGASLTEITKATQVLVEQSRAEFNDLPTQRFGFESEDELDAAIQTEFARLTGFASRLALVAGNAQGAALAALEDDAGADAGDAAGTGGQPEPDAS